MGTTVWPFLVSRNEKLDYQIVVAPDFMVDAGVAGILAANVSGDLTPGPRYLELSHRQFGKVAVYYRVVKATRDDEVLHDRASRPILWLEGIVSKGSGRQLAVTPEDLIEAHRRVADAYERFWLQTKPTQPEPSSAFEIGRMVETQKPAQRVTSPPPSLPVASAQTRDRRSTALPWVLVGSMLALLLCMAAFVALIGALRQNGTDAKLTVHGRVYDVHTEQPVAADIYLNGGLVSRASEEFSVTLTVDQPSVKITIKAPGYFPADAVIEAKDAGGQVILSLFLIEESVRAPED